MRNQQQTLIHLSKVNMPDDIERTLWFSEWWDMYPHKVSKVLARRTFVKHMQTRADYATLTWNTNLWTKVFLARQPDKRPYPATFLNSGAWREPPPPDLLYASMDVGELIERGLDPAQHGWRKRRVSGGSVWER